MHKNGLKFENIYLYAKTLYQGKYTLLKNIINGKTIANIDNSTISAFEHFLNTHFGI
jgi:hypothetical protein